MQSEPVSFVLSRTTPAQRLLARQFLQFAIIGTAGFVWDTCIIYAIVGYVGPYAAGMISFIIVGSINWLLNRFWTYRNLSHDAMHRQLVRFLIANAVGLVLNRGTYMTLIATQPLFRAHLVLAIAAGGGAGMFVNFFLSRKLVFR
jgi:putative flippase GtrA